MSTLFIDFETKSSADIRKTGSFKYVRDPDFSILLTAYAFGGEEVKVHPFGIPDRVVDHLDSSDTDDLIVVHNQLFEIPVFDSYGITVDPRRVIDTAQIARSLSYPDSLGRLAPYLGVEGKLGEGKGLISLFSKPPFASTEENKEKWEMFQKYAMQDVVAMRECYNIMNSAECLFTPQWEKELRAVDFEINDRGVNLDIPVISKARDLAERYRKVLTEKFRDLTGINPTQRDKFLEWVRDNGVNISDLTAGTVRKYLGKEGVSPQVKKALKMKALLSKTSVRKLDAMLNYACEDNRARGLLRYHRATTGRWGGSGIQIQNMPRGNVGDVELAFEAIQADDSKGISKIGNPLDVISSCLRGMLIPSRGNRFVVIDYAAIEGRCLNWLAGQEDRIQMYRDGVDLYKVMASEIYGIPVSEVTKKQRQLGKTAVLACGYGMGGKKFKLTCQNMGVEVTERMAYKAVETFRASHGRVKRFWRSAEKAFHQAVHSGGGVVNLKSEYVSTLFKVVGKDLKVILPSGRCINYPRAEMRMGMTPWGDEQLTPHYFGAETGRVDWKMQSTYGGKIVENITQAVARDVLAEALIELKHLGYDIVFHVHDEIVMEAGKNKDILTDVEKIMSKPPEWADRLPLAVEGFYCERYRK